MPVVDWNKLAVLAEKLAERQTFVRVDFRVNQSGGIRFEKLTFTPESGIRAWADEAVNRRFGDKIVLPIKNPIPQYEGYDRMKKEIIARGR